MAIEKPPETRAAAAIARDVEQLTRVAGLLADLDEQRDTLQNERDRIVLTLTQGGMTYAQIGTAGGMTSGNVFHIVDRARRSEAAKRKTR